ncbi:STN domain-containing protein, partial [Klebsiella pneumoniae]|nr:STN domain-containing protein [Klebsiella pneumoniae]
RFAFSNDILPSGQTVTVNVKRAPVSEVLNQVLEPTRLKYRFADESGIIIISEKTGDGATEHAPLILFQQVTGKVTDDKGNGLAG